MVPASVMKEMHKYSMFLGSWECFSCSKYLKGDGKGRMSLSISDTPQRQ